MSFVCRNASVADIESIVDLHLASFDQKELSSILGKRFVRTLYRLCITSGPKVLVTVIASDTSHIAAVSMIFFQYTDFERVFKKKALLPFLASMTDKVLRLKWKQIFFILRSISSRNFHSYISSKDIYDHYIGSLIIGKENKSNPPVILAAYKMFSDNVKKLKKASSAGVWASVRVSNKPSLKMMFDQGLKEIIRVSDVPEDILVCVYRTSANEARMS
jgi:hypothetical protein